MAADTLTCGGAVHGTSNRAWRRGCRCGPALAAHQEVLDRMAAERTRNRAEGLRTGVCACHIHGTDQAVKRGCICVRRQRDVRRAARRASGKLPGDLQRQYNRFRGPAMKVNPFNLMLLLGGCVDQPTRGEMVAAVYRLSRRGNRAGTGIMNCQEISVRLGVDDGQVHRYRRLAREFRDDRKRRRYLDVLHKQQIVARALARKAARDA